MSNKKIEISEEDVFRLFEKKKRRADIADAALDNIIIPFPGFDSTTYDKDFWKVLKKEKYGNSYTLYIHTLRVAAELILAYEATQDLKYFDKAEEIINSWIEHIRTDNENKMIWYDHTTANRTQVLIHYLYIAYQLNRKINITLFKNLLMKHAEVLSNDGIYKHNNHGLMMDRSLMILGYVLEDNSLLLKGKTRAVNTFWYSFSSQGIHLENSPQYHSMVLRMYNEIESYLNKKNDSLGDHIPKYLTISKAYIPVITKPDQRLPSIGDSSNTKQGRRKIYRNLYDVEAGISIMQYEKPYVLYTTFIAGYSSMVHKHKDDLSITLNYRLKDFLVDPGKYSYTSNETRKYITSKEAHSSFYLKGQDYTINNDNRYNRKIRLDNYYDNKNYTLVSGYNNDYDVSRAKLSRTVIQLKNSPIVLLIDQVDRKSKNPRRIEQNFNLATDVIIEKKDDKYKLISGDEEMMLRQFIPSYRTSVIEGSLEPPVALNTAGFAEVEKTKQIKFNRSTKEQNVFLTAIYDKRVTGEINVTIKDDILEVIVEDKSLFVYL